MPQPVVQQAPQQQVQQAPQQQQVLAPQQQVQPGPDGKVPIGVLLTQENYTTTKAQSARDSELCPDCQSPNYMRSNQSPNSLKQCFDCGFNQRFQHSTHGASGIGQKDLPQFEARSQGHVPDGAPPMGTVVGHI